jgi:protein-L-isoaspartate(D-aspartate) O-methyltransferase
VRSLHLDSAPDQTCWFAGDGWWLSTVEVEGEEWRLSTAQAEGEA